MVARADGLTSAEKAVWTLPTMTALLQSTDEATRVLVGNSTMDDRAPVRVLLPACAHAGSIGADLRADGRRYDHGEQR
jgi:hypothetical protein